MFMAPKFKIFDFTRNFQIQAETELVKASAEFSKTLHNLEEKSTDFEKQKIHDIKSILLDFISIEMGYHARALEVLTNAYKGISSIDEEADLQVKFRFFFQR